MEHLNQTFFLWLNAPEQPNSLLMSLATFFSEWLIWVVPILIGISWLIGNENTRKALLISTMSGLLGLLINQIIGLAWSHPRPFMIGLGHTLIPHVADSSFPSDHLTLWWSVTFSFLPQRGLRRAGIALTLFGLPIAWSRIYLGVHFPLDILGAIAVASLGAVLALHEAHRYVGPIYRLATRIHCLLFSKLIAYGWVRE
jgi:undecaprenyl-diphosphatase